MTLTTGTKLGRYEVEGPLGAGGMGEVYRAKDTRLERTVKQNRLRLAVCRPTGSNGAIPFTGITSA